jgi:hypothetical protein
LILGLFTDAEVQCGVSNNEYEWQIWSEVGGKKTEDNKMSSVFLRGKSLKAGHQHWHSHQFLKTNNKKI